MHTNLTHEDLAALVAATRVTVSKGLSELRQEGMKAGMGATVSTYLHSRRFSECKVRVKQLTAALLTLAIIPS